MKFVFINRLFAGRLGRTCGRVCGASAMWATACGAVLLAWPRTASGSLGGDIASIAVDLGRLNGVDHVLAGRNAQVHEIRLPGGTIVREYLSSAGTVFAVTWHGPFRPNLRQLLGTYFDGFERVVRTETNRGRRPFVVEQPELVVHMGGQPRAFFGRAYVPDLIPQDVSPTDLR